jgi:hypothetical protein
MDDLAPPELPQLGEDDEPPIRAQGRWNLGFLAGFALNISVATIVTHHMYFDGYADRGSAGAVISTAISCWGIGLPPALLDAGTPRGRFWGLFLVLVSPFTALLLLNWIATWTGHRISD